MVEPHGMRRRGDAADLRPDIVLVMTDQQRFDQVGFASGGHFETPNIDGLARSGVRFDTAYSASTTCVPARTSLLTGLQASRVPTATDGIAARPGSWNVAHALRDAGYQTALVGKMHFHPARSPHGFDVSHVCEHLFAADFDSQRRPHLDLHDDYHDWLHGLGVPDWRADPPPKALVADPRSAAFPLDAALHPTSWVADRATDVLRSRDPSRPLFLVVSFPHPHAPWNPPEPYVSRYDPADAVVPADDFSVNDHLPDPFRRDLGIRFGPFIPERAGGESTVRWVLTLARARIHQVDDAVGQVLAQVDRDRSVVLFTSDHGDYAGHRGLLQKVPWIPFDDLARVPLVVAAPDAAAGASVTALVQSSDIALTCLDYAGVEPPPVSFDSRSLRPHLTGTPSADDLDRTVLCTTTFGYPMARRGNLKRIERTLLDGASSVVFDLDADPGETTDVQADPRHREAGFELALHLQWAQAQPVPDLPGFAPLVVAGS